MIRAARGFLEDTIPFETLSRPAFAALRHGRVRSLVMSFRVNAGRFTLTSDRPQNERGRPAGAGSGSSAPDTFMSTT